MFHVQHVHLRRHIDVPTHRCGAPTLPLVWNCGAFNVHAGHHDLVGSIRFYTTVDIKGDTTITAETHFHIAWEFDPMLEVVKTLTLFEPAFPIKKIRVKPVVSHVTVL